MNEHLRQVVALNFSTAVWVSCEIASCHLSKNHYFLSLIQKEAAGGIVAHAEAIIWAGIYRKLKKIHGKQIDAVLNKGLQTKLKVRLDFHERFGLKLIVEDIDLVHTIGVLQMERLKAIEELKTKGLMEKNKSLALPTIIQNVAILSSPQAAGYLDFQAHINSNPYHYQFNLSLYPIAVQGEAVEQELLKQLKKIKRSKQATDVVVLTRGGGANIDLSVFDKLALAKAVANYPIPILTGIGHFIDESVVDLVAHTALKTPTALADFILQHNAYAETLSLQLYQKIVTQIDRQSKQYLHQLQHLGIALDTAVNSILISQQKHLQSLEHQIEKGIENSLKKSQQKLEYLRTLLEAHDIEQTLNRGFTITMQSGKPIRYTHQLNTDESITTYFQDGKIESKITE